MGNTESRGEYIIELLMIIVVIGSGGYFLFPDFSLYCYGLIISKGAVIMVVCALEFFIMFFLTYKNERNKESIFVTGGLTALLLGALYFWKLEVQIWVIALIAEVIFKTLICWMCKMISNTFNEQSSRFTFRKRSRLYSGLVSGCCILGVMVGAGWYGTSGSNQMNQFLNTGDFDSFSFVRSVPDYDEWMSHDEENKLSYHMDDICMFDRWSELSDSQKKTALSALRAVECRYLGLPKEPRIIIDDIGERTEGQYNDNDHTVIIDTDVFYGTDGYKVINVVSHEIHHMYTYKQMEFFSKMYRDSNYYEYANMLIFSGIVKCIEESTNYIDGDDDWQTYYDQELERTAFEYAATSEMHYREYISSYKNS